MEGMDENTRIIQLTSASLIDAYQNESSLWDYRLNSSEDEKERAWARLSKLFGVSEMHVSIFASQVTLMFKQCFGFIFLDILYLVNCKLYYKFANPGIYGKPVIRHFVQK